MHQMPYLDGDSKKQYQQSDYCLQRLFYIANALEYGCSGQLFLVTDVSKSVPFL
jgi:hypothetical protein